MKVSFISLNTFEPIDTPLGIASIVAYCKRYIQVEFRLFDANFHNVLEETTRFNPEIIGITSMTNDYKKVIDFAKEIKLSLNARIILGGVHISTLPESFQDCFDIAVIGEGEETFLEILQNKPLKDIKGILYWENGKIKKTEQRPLLNINSLPIPDRSIFHKNYFKPRPLPTNKLGIRGTIISSRGCPFKCSFCSTSNFWKKPRYSSPERTVMEIEDLIKNYNVEYIYIWDDLFTLNKEKLKETINLIKKKGLKFQAQVQLRADSIDEELLELLKELNVVEVSFGLESGSQKILNHLKSNTTTVEQNKNAILLCKKHGFKTSAAIIFGSPYEKIEDLKETIKLIEFLYKNGVHDISPFVLTPFPGTKMWELAKERKKVSNNLNWDLLDLYSSNNAYNPLLLDEDVDKKEFRKLIKKIGRLQKKFKTRILLEEIKSNPLDIAKRIIKKPKTAIKFLIKRSIYRL
ncbi:B12-binding domain-containing radical SAM protein [Candidatus Woesearchaeota archaeon]|nr:B12-binding domain-containing radical SAM protein [Candidatus Woesearchaeota archaeon]